MFTLKSEVQHQVGMLFSIVVFVKAADVVLYIPFMRGTDVIAVHNTQAFIKRHGHNISAAAVLILFFMIYI